MDFIVAYKENDPLCVCGNSEGYRQCIDNLLGCYQVCPRATLWRVKSKGFTSLVLHLRRGRKQNCVLASSPVKITVHISRALGLCLHHKVVLAFTSGGQFYEPTCYLWLWNKIITHLNLSSKGPVFSVWGLTSRYSFFSCLAKHCPACLKWIPILICPLMMYLADLRHYCSWPFFSSSQTEEHLSKLSLKYAFCF